MVASRRRDKGQVLGVTLSCDVVNLVAVGFLMAWFYYWALEGKSVGTVTWVWSSTLAER